MNRREFIVSSTATLLLTAAGGSYVFSSCPLDTEGSGVCTGPCSAFIDFDGDGFCDRLPPPVQVAEAGQPAVPPVIQQTCPLGILNDPYPGQCYLYVDRDGDGICDLSQNQQTPPAAEQNDVSAPAEPSAQPTAGAILTVCPLGLINDPYPGQCRQYVDNNNNGICDLAEPELVASGAVTAPPAVTSNSSGGSQPRRRGRNK